MLKMLFRSDPRLMEDKNYFQDKEQTSVDQKTNNKDCRQWINVWYVWFERAFPASAKSSDENTNRPSWC